MDADFTLDLGDLDVDLLTYLNAFQSAAMKLDILISTLHADFIFDLKLNLLTLFNVYQITTMKLDPLECFFKLISIFCYSLHIEISSVHSSSTNPWSRSYSGERFRAIMALLLLFRRLIYFFHKTRLVSLYSIGN